MTQMNMRSRKVRDIRRRGAAPGFVAPTEAAAAKVAAAKAAGGGAEGAAAARLQDALRHACSTAVLLQSVSAPRLLSAMQRCTDCLKVGDLAVLRGQAAGSGELCAQGASVGWCKEHADGHTSCEWGTVTRAVTVQDVLRDAEVMVQDHMGGQPRRRRLHELVQLGERAPVPKCVRILRMAPHGMVHVQAPGQPHEQQVMLWQLAPLLDGQQRECGGLQQPGEAVVVDLEAHTVVDAITLTGWDACITTHVEPEFGGTTAARRDLNIALGTCSEAPTLCSNIAVHAADGGELLVALEPAQKGGSAPCVGLGCQIQGGVSIF